MKKNKNKGFTLIELIAVLVIMAIIALIVTPLVLNIVRKAKDSANKRSVDAYGKSIDLAVASYLLDNEQFPTSIDQLTIEYSGKEVICGITKLNEDSSLYLSKCSVGGVEVKDSKTEDGWYHYGTTTYKEYKIGDVITYNGMNFYVIENSDENSDSVTMLKAEPIKTSEVDLSGIEIASKVTESTNNYSDGYIYSAYLYLDSCTSIAISNGIAAGCTNDYKLSSIKQVIDAWAADKFKSIDLKEYETGYSARLITQDELINNLGYEYFNNGSLERYISTKNTPEWIYNVSYPYWTMSQYNDSVSDIFILWREGYLAKYNINTDGSIRPVVTLYKSAL